MIMCDRKKLHTNSPHTRVLLFIQREREGPRRAKSVVKTAPLDDEEMQPIAEKGGGPVRMVMEDRPGSDCYNNRFPRAIVWGPLPPITCCIPCIGHMGIADSKGYIHDFAGPYYIGVDDFMVGPVWRYATLPHGPSDEEWDLSIETADAEYRHRMHNIVCDVSSHSALKSSLPPPLA